MFNCITTILDLSAIALFHSINPVIAMAEELHRKYFRYRHYKVESHIMKVPKLYLRLTRRLRRFIENKLENKFITMQRAYFVYMYIRFVDVDCKFLNSCVNAMYVLTATTIE